MKLVACLAALALSVGLGRLLGTAEVEVKLVGEGVISTPDDETAITFDPDGKTAYFGKRSPTTAGQPLDVICMSHHEHGIWNELEIAPFSGNYRDVTPAMAPDGSKLFFASNRPTGDGPKKDFDLWYVSRSGSGWSDAKRLPASINTPNQDYGVSVSANGTVYFASNRPGGKGGFDIYRSRLMNGEYQQSENLGEPINTEGSELFPAISPDGRILVFTAFGRSDEITGIHREYNKGDLYVSYFDKGAWTTPRNAGPPLNSGAGESAPNFSADGKFLYFASERGFATYRQPSPLDYKTLQSKLSSTLNGLGNLYEISVSALPR